MFYFYFLSPGHKFQTFVGLMGKRSFEDEGMTLQTVTLNIPEVINLPGNRWFIPAGAQWAEQKTDWGSAFVLVCFISKFESHSVIVSLKGDISQWTLAKRSFGENSAI